MQLQATDPVNKDAIETWLDRLPDTKLEWLYKNVSDEITSANGNVVSYNPMVTACLGCNTAIYHLSNTAQSNGSIYYISPYL